MMTRTPTSRKVCIRLSAMFTSFTDSVIFGRDRNPGLFQICSNNSPRLILRLGLLFALLILSIQSYMLWGVNIIGADDPFIAVDRFRSGDIFQAAKGQAVGQGRFYWLLTYPVAQIPYFLSATWYLSLIKITANLLVIYFFHRLLRVLFGPEFAVVTSLIYLCLAIVYRPDFNIFRDAPLSFGLAAILVMVALTRYSIELYTKQDSTIGPFLIFGLGLLFYEPIIFYSLLFPMIKLAHCGGGVNSLYSFNFINRFKYLLLILAVYLLAYSLFRVNFPSNYEGNNSLAYPGIDRFLLTVANLSFYGLNSNFGALLSAPGNLFSLALAFIAFVFLISIFRMHCYIHYCRTARADFFLFFLLLYSVICPNLLFGLLDKYHPWSDHTRYYIGTYFSTFSLSILLSFLLIRFINFSRGLSFFNSNLIVIPFCIATLTYGNFNSAIEHFDRNKGLANRWLLMDRIAPLLANHVADGDTLCTSTLFASDDSFGQYDYWSYYLSQELGKTVSVVFSKYGLGECQWHLTYQGDSLSVVSAAGGDLRIDVASGE